MSTINNSDEVYINVGNMLEAQLERWRGGRSHGRGIAEYVTNSDDSYRRLRKFSDQKIEVEYILAEDGISISLSFAISPRECPLKTLNTNFSFISRAPAEDSMVRL